MEAETVVNTEKTAECQLKTSPCNKKMLKFLRFSLSMEDSELDVLKEPQPELQEKDIEEDYFSYDDVFHSLTTMSLNLMADQESDADNPLTCNESEIVSDTANISYISEQICRVIKEQRNFLKTHTGCKYVTSKQNEICLENTMSAKITIFWCIHGMVTHDKSLGVPVMLNFTDTNNYLCCRKENDVILTIKDYEMKNRCLSADNPEKSLIFYMSQKFDGLRYFESALHRGWFIHTINDDTVKMKRGNSTSSSSFVLETTEPTEY